MPAIAGLGSGFHRAGGRRPGPAGTRAATRQAAMKGTASAGWTTAQAAPDLVGASFKSLRRPT